VSEGITDYYADLAVTRGGIVTPEQFMNFTSDKIGNVTDSPPTALEDASLSTWIHPTDGSEYLYYPKGSLAGLMLDILIRDASDNRRSLDDVMRGLYRTTYKQGRGFTAADWWRAVSTAAEELVSDRRSRTSAAGSRSSAPRTGSRDLRRGGATIRAAH